MEKSRNGKIEYSHRFGNQKNVVLQQSNMGNFVVNIYDNRPNFNGRPSLAFEEAVQFSELVSQLEMMKENYKEENKTTSNPTKASGSTTYNPEPFVPPTYKPELYTSSIRGSAEMPPHLHHIRHKKKERKAEDAYPGDLISLLNDINK